MIPRCPLTIRGLFAPAASPDRLVQCACLPLLRGSAWEFTGVHKIGRAAAERGSSPSLRFCKSRLRAPMLHVRVSGVAFLHCLDVNPARRARSIVAHLNELSPTPN
jgi:hypothetical protein